MSAAAELAEQLRPAIGNRRVLAAIASVPRERFVPECQRERAYENVALPIGCGQTISQPLVVARMLETLELQPADRVLDVGTGSGYHACVLSLLCARVFTIERHGELSAGARTVLDSLGIDNVELHVGDGYAGLPSQAPFDAINVAAAAGDSVPEALTSQLAPGGRMVTPVGGADQHLVLTRRTARGIEHTRLEAVRFVPLVREEDGSR